MSRENETRIQNEIRRAVSDHYTRLKLDAARVREAQRRRDGDSDVITFVAGVIVGVAVAAVHATRRP